MRRPLLLLAFISMFTLAAPGAAQTWPTKPVRLVLGYAAGGAMDMSARVIGPILTESIGQPVIIENRTGGAGNIAADAVAKSAPDGYTLLATSDGPLVINPSVYKNLSFDTLRDFAPIAIAASAGLVLMACPSLPASSVAEVLALARGRKLTYASSGYGSSQHVAAELLKDSAGIDLTHVPYKGFGHAVVDAVSCTVDLIFGAISTGLPYVRSGKLKAIAVTQPRRHPGLADTPTFGEAGHPAVVIEAYMGLLAPAGTPRAVIERLHAEVAAILEEKETSQRLTGAGLDVVRSTPEAYARRIRADLEKYARLASALAAKE